MTIHSSVKLQRRQRAHVNLGQVRMMKNFWYSELSESKCLNKRSWTCNNIFLKGLAVLRRETLISTTPFRKPRGSTQLQAQNPDVLQVNQWQLPPPCISFPGILRLCVCLFILSALCLRQCWLHCSRGYPQSEASQDNG